MTAAAVIATRNRPEPLRRCLQSIETQALAPQEVVVVDSSDNDATESVVGEFAASPSIRFRYEHTAVRSAAQQRNIGARLIDSDIVFFLDDDVALESKFFAAIVTLFEGDPECRIGGISGTISNQVYSPPRGFNRFLLSLCTGEPRGDYAGRLMGPAINFLPSDGNKRVQEVEWLPSGCTAYRTDVFLRHEFAAFEGYSFAEDVHLSARIAKTHTLLNTTAARLFHEDLGQLTHKNWRAIGESVFWNRHLIMTAVLGRVTLSHYLRLLFFELVYSPIAYMAGGVSRRRILNQIQLCLGKSRAALAILMGRRVHAASKPPAAERA